jgi:hypothetical protein
MISGVCAERRWAYSVVVDVERSVGLSFCCERLPLSEYQTPYWTPESEGRIK